MGKLSTNSAVIFPPGVSGAESRSRSRSPSVEELDLLMDLGSNAPEISGPERVTGKRPLRVAGGVRWLDFPGRERHDLGGRPGSACLPQGP
jgi:hypothetical protein